MSPKRSPRLAAAGITMLSGILLLAACSSGGSNKTEAGLRAPAASPSAAPAAPEANPTTPAAPAEASGAPAAQAPTTPGAPVASSGAAMPATKAASSAVASPGSPGAAKSAASANAAPTPGKPAPGTPGASPATPGGGGAATPVGKATGFADDPTKVDGSPRTTESPEVGVSPTGIKFGGISFNTYPMANILTYPEIGAVQMVWDKTNDEGGIFGRKMSIIDCDDAGDASRSRSCYKKEVQQDKIFAFTSSVTWYTGEAGPDLERDKIPWIGNWGFFTREWNHPWMFPSHAAAVHEAHANAEWIAKNLGVKKVGYLYTNIPEMNLARKAAEEVFAKFGVQIVKAIPLEISSADQSQNVIAMRTANPEHIMHSGYPSPIVKWMIDASQQDYWPAKGVTTNHFIIELIGKVLGEYPIQHGLSTVTTFNIWGDDYTANIEKYAPNMREKSHHNSQGAWGVANIFVKAAKEVGPDLTRTKVMKVLESRPWDMGRGFDQTFVWKPGNHDTLRDYFMFDITCTDTTMKGPGCFKPAKAGFRARDNTD